MGPDRLSKEDLFGVSGSEKSQRLMPCFHPIEVMVLRKSLYKRIRDSYPQVVPCGRCVGCRAEQGRQWAVRMMHEARMHKDNLFVTLTYSDQELPKNAELVPKDFSGFVKRLRKTQERRISYFGCGEYGERTRRPHYHALFFGLDLEDRDIGFDDSRPDVWRSETLENVWGRGRTEGGSVTMASASYVAGYVQKKQRAKDMSRCNPLTGELLQPEFARMSLRPAIGKNWIKKWWADVYPRDFVVIDGWEAKPPRYYDKFMDLEDDKGGTPERRDLMESVRTKRYDEAVELTKYQLKAGEAIVKGRINLFAGRDGI